MVSPVFNSVGAISYISYRKNLLLRFFFFLNTCETFQKNNRVIIVKLSFSVSPGACHLWRKWAGLQQLGTGRTLLALQLLSLNPFHCPPGTFCLGRVCDNSWQSLSHNTPKHPVWIEEFPVMNCIDGESFI